MSLYTTLFLRAVLAVIRLTGGHATLTSPNPTPTAKERGKYHSIGADGRSKNRWDTIFLQTTTFTKISLHAINTLEFFAIICAIIDLPPRLSHFSPSIVRPRPSTTAIVGSLLMGVGGALRVASYRAMGGNFTFELAIKKDHTLITHGPYSVVRHPSYAAGFFFLPGMLLAFVGPGGVFDCLDLWRFTLVRFWGVALVLASLYLGGMVVKRCSIEDKALRAEFKEKWVAWSNEVPYRLVPYIY